MEKLASLIFGLFFMLLLIPLLFAVLVLLLVFALGGLIAYLLFGRGLRQRKRQITES